MSDARTDILRAIARATSQDPYRVDLLPGDTGWDLAVCLTDVEHLRRPCSNPDYSPGGRYDPCYCARCTS